MDISKNKDSWVKIHGGCKYILINYLRKHLMHVAIRWVGVPHCFLEPYIFLIFIYYNRNIIFKELDHTHFQDKYMN